MTICPSHIISITNSILTMRCECVQWSHVFHVWETIGRELEKVGLSHPNPMTGLRLIHAMYVFSLLSMPTFSIKLIDFWSIKPQTWTMMATLKIVVCLCARCSNLTKNWFIWAWWSLLMFGLHSSITNVISNDFQFA